jgi:hypothetical protein
MGAGGPDGGDLRLHICRRQTTFPSVSLSKFQSFAPIGAAQVSFHRIADKLLRGNFLFCSSFLDLLKQLCGKPYALDCHGSILHLWRPWHNDRSG